MVLLRHLLGDVLRRLRLRQGRTLREVSAAARVSLGYLSEVERGQKEASSELLSAICTALGVPLSRVLREVSDGFALAELQSAPVLGGPAELAISGRPSRDLVPEPVLAGSRHTVLEGPVPAREVLASQPLRPGMIGQPAHADHGPFGQRPVGIGGIEDIGDIKDMVSV